MDASLLAAARGLAQRYPDVSDVEIVALLSSATDTVARVVGHPDLDMAVDLAQLRLDVRARLCA